MAQRSGIKRTSEEVLQAVREGISLGMTYQDINQITGASAGVIANEKRGMGLKLGHGPHPAPQNAPRVSSDILSAVGEAISMGMSYAEIMTQFHVSSTVIADVKRQKGLIKTKRSSGNRVGKRRRERDIQLATAILDALPRLPEDYWEGTATELLAIIGSQAKGLPTHAIGLSTVLAKPHVNNALKDYGITVQRTIKRGLRLIHLSYMSQAPQAPQAPTPAPTPAPTQVQEQQPSPEHAYFEAIRAGILEGYAREEALEANIEFLQSRIISLESTNRELRDDLTQVRAQRSNWAGPVPIPSRNLSTGG